MRPHVKKITLSDKLYIHKDDVDEDNTTRLGDTFTYRIKDNKIYQTISEEGNYYVIPSNAYSKINFDEVVDKRTYEELPKPISFHGKLRPEQQEVLEEFTKEKGRAVSGILCSPCGFGKSFVGCSLIAKTSVPTLILVHTKLLFYQWKAELENQLKITPGLVGDGKYDIQPITVGIYKSVNNNLKDLRDKFSFVIVDECHLCASTVFSQTLCGLSAKIKVGLSATPMRTDQKHKAFSDFFTSFKVEKKDARNLATPRVALIPTDISFNVIDPKRDWAKKLTTLGNNKEYQNLIANHAISDISKGRLLIIMAERIAMLKALQKKIKTSVLLIGSTPKEEREEILKNAGTKYNAILTTKIFDEGISLNQSDTLYLTSPASSKIKLEQRIGRILREHPNKQIPLIRDFQLKGLIVSQQQMSRKDWYRNQGFVVV